MTHKTAAAPAIAAILALLCGVAEAATLSANPANFIALIKAAKPGDVVQLQSGTYPPMNLTNITKAGAVTIKPAPRATVKTSAINANGSTNLVLDGIDVAITPGTQYGVQAGGPGRGQGMVFRNLKVHQADNRTLAGGGFWIRNGGGVTLDHNDVSWVSNAITILDSSRAVVTNNAIHAVSVDGIDLAGAANALVKGNTGTNFHQARGAHPDFIQWWRTALTPSPCGMNIGNNSFTRGAGTATQGIFGEDGCNVTIIDNILRGTMYNGIALARSVGVTISGNFVDGYLDMESRLFIRGGCSHIKIIGNAAQSITNYATASAPGCSDVTIANNILLKAASYGDDTQLNAWLRGRQRPPATTPVVYSPSPPPIVFLGGAVPEPQTWAQLIAGLALLGAVLRRSRRVTTSA